ncbi:MAG: PepSY domain-containing protein [Devosia sp.]|uniref:PepSY domain-containing protein n=1 Tax=Devosia sp. TaxID=1871048 RepID=UPI001ACA2739|nr:hypothetical protein [Devosia sp.]MBN9310149.1 PepSY domain-containing protein [Devosia sp.]MBN9314588.1 PepSY domain-containing protein [Devosia sp.]
MDRRHILVLLFALSALPATAALADDDSEDHSGDDSPDDGGSDHDGEDDDGESGGKDHDSVLKAVEDDGALSLEQFLPLFRRQLEGRVVDVSLTERRGALLFVVTFIDPAGRVRRARFDARTGYLVEQ